ncbi:MAG: type II secretion system protein [Deltaproteobacteria bacterium]|nr:type II secretion system protein [Deltaproteobacteria bacterium]
MKSSRGMTLLEVLVAVAILAISFVLLIRTHIQSFTMISESEILNRAALLSESVCARIEAYGWADVSVLRGYDPGPPRLFYQTSVMESSYPNVRKVTVRVARGREAKPLLEISRWVVVH